MRYLLFVILLCCKLDALPQFLTEEKVLAIPSGELKGTLLIPKNAKNFSLIIIQAGSGPTDRNGNSVMGVKANTYRLVAEALSEKNIATLLIDKRGVAGSIKAVKSEASMRFDDYIVDLIAWVGLLKSDKRVGKIFLAGHSEGSLVAMNAALKVKVNGYISIAGAGESIDKIIVWQYAQQAPKEALLVDSLFTRMRSNQKLDSIPKSLMAIFRPSVQPYMLSWMLHNPCTEIGKLKIPILILQGTTDLQVQVKEAETLKLCNPAATLKIIQGMNHCLKLAPEDVAKNYATYADASLPLIPGLIEEIVTFINRKK
jgi:hypothetical protein